MGVKRYLVEKQKMAANIRTLRARLGERRMWAVIKADGYGLGAEALTRFCGENGLKCFAVTELDGAKAVRQAGVPVEQLLLMTSADPAEIPQLLELGVTFTVATEADVENLAPYTAEAHIKVDTGMGRRGFLAEDRARIASIYTQYPNLTVTGIYTHFSNGTDIKTTRRQFDRFCTVLDALQQEGIEPGLRHCCASSAVFCEDAWLLDGARIGSALLGRVAGVAGRELLRTGICQVAIESVRRVPKGTDVGYGSLYRTTSNRVLALCPVGTHNGVGVTVQAGAQRPIRAFLGLLRQLRNRIFGRACPVAVVNGRKCRAVGGICSEMVVLDVTGVPCKAGDLAQFDINPILLHDVPVEFV